MTAPKGKASSWATIVAAPLPAKSGLPDTGGLPQVLFDNADDVERHPTGGDRIACGDRLVELAMHREGAAREIALAERMLPEAVQRRVQLPHDLREQGIAGGAVDGQVELPILLRCVTVAQMHALHMLQAAADLGDRLVAGAQRRQLGCLGLEGAAQLQGALEMRMLELHGEREMHGAGRHGHAQISAAADPHVEDAERGPALQRLAQCRAADPQSLAQLALRRQAVAGLQPALEDRKSV